VVREVSLHAVGETVVWHLLSCILKYYAYSSAKLTLYLSPAHISSLLHKLTRSYPRET